MQTQPGLTRHRTAFSVDGPAANERLTAWAGAVLIVLLAVEGITLLGIHQLIVPHIVVGLALIGPLALKLASTGYRFVRYYTNDPAYRRSGPPQTLLRILAPLLIVTTITLFGSGTLLLFLPDGQRGLVVAAHKASFILWFMLTSVHVLAYVWRVPRLIGGDLFRREGALRSRGSAARLAALGVAVTSGVVLAGLLLGRAQAWSQFFTFRHDR